MTAYCPHVNLYQIIGTSGLCAYLNDWFWNQKERIEPYPI
jgi:hypothetical protein